MRIRTVVISASAGLGVAAVVAGGYLFWSAGHYNQEPWSDYPSSLSWCGRDWQAGGSVTRDQVLKTDYDFREAGDLPGWLNRGQVWTSRERGAEPFTRCNISRVWVRTGTDRFEQMDLEGSP